MFERRQSPGSNRRSFGIPFHGNINHIRSIGFDRIFKHCSKISRFFDSCSPGSAGTGQGGKIRVIEFAGSFVSEGGDDLPSRPSSIGLMPDHIPSVVIENDPNRGNVVFDCGAENVGSHHESSITCLLYTSPSPRDAHESRMPSSA